VVGPAAFVGAALEQWHLQAGCIKGSSEACWAPPLGACWQGSSQGIHLDPQCSSPRRQEGVSAPLYVAQLSLVVVCRHVPVSELAPMADVDIFAVCYRSVCL